MLKLADATMTSQGQISIPKQIRERLHLQKGDKIVFLEDEKGNVIIQEAEPVTKVKNRKEALRHLDQLSKKKK